MFSICLPVYRYDVRPLVRELLRQAAELTDADDAPFEILVYDDASPDDEDWGRATLRSLAGIRYEELAVNLGRAAIRNKMAREAKFDYVLLLDADGWPGPDFLNDWFVVLQDLWNTSEQVAVGGRSYAEKAPSPAFHLHWHYGRKRESASASERANTPYLGFQSNNFLVERAVLLAHPFPEKVAGYGHEDTIWGQQLEGAGVSILHVHNPVVHLGLEPVEVFLRKQKQAIENLRSLKNEHPHLRTRLIDLTENYPRLTSLARYLPEDLLVKRLKSGAQPFLYFLDALKLKWWYA